MRKILPALAATAVAGPAFAQSSVTLYGIADAALERLKGGTNSVNRLSSGQWNGSRWGLRGVEDLGGGLKAVMVLESGFNIDSGTSGQGGALFGRQAFVGLGGGWGTVRLGRQYTPTDDVASLIGTKVYDVLSVARIMGVENTDRLNNTLTYVTPSLSGLEVQVQYSLGNENAAAPNLAKSFNVGGVYKGGPISVGLGLIRVTDNDAATAGNQRRQGVLLVGSYDFGPAKATGYVGTQDQAAERLKIFGGAVAMPFGAATVSLGAAKVKNANGSAAAASDDATLVTLQGKYDLSKRTALYSNLTAVSNDAAAALGFNTPVAGKNSSGIQVGLRHSF